jgi:hypothetical protein
MNVTLEEAQSKINIDVIHFKVFGCESLAHIPDEKHKAMQSKSE